MVKFQSMIITLERTDVINLKLRVELFCPLPVQNVLSATTLPLETLSLEK